MRTKLTILAGALAFSAVLQADTSYHTLDFNTTSPGITDGGYAISPYTGTVDGITVQLYCDDINDTIGYGQQNISVRTTGLIVTPTNTSYDISHNTRYGVDNPSSNSSYVAGTTLYEEMAWLATQMQQNSTSVTNQKAIQEAIWQLTDAPGGDIAPNKSRYNTGHAWDGDSGAAQTAAKWISDAQSYINTGFNASDGSSTWTYASDYANLTVDDWTIVTAVNAGGCTTGNSGVNGTGCTPGHAGSGSTTQEFLAYKQGGLFPPTNPTGGGSSGAVPEPASFVLIGSGLLAGALITRRRRTA